MVDGEEHQGRSGTATANADAAEGEQRAPKKVMRKPKKERENTNTANKAADNQQQQDGEDSTSNGTGGDRKPAAAAAGGAAKPKKKKKPATGGGGKDQPQQSESARSAHAPSPPTSSSPGPKGRSKTQQPRKKRSQQADKAQAAEQDQPPKAAGAAGKKKTKKKKDDAPPGDGASSPKSSKKKRGGSGNGNAKAKVSPTASSSSPLKGTRRRSQRLSMTATVSSNVVTRVTFYLNGDKQFAGKQVMVDSRQTPTFERLLDHLSEQLDPPFGPVMKIYDANTFEPIKEIAQLRTTTHAVTVGRKAPLKKLAYTDIQSFRSREQTYVAPDLTRVKSKFDSKVQSRVHKAAEVKQIFALVNGDEDGVGVRVILRPRVLESWELVLQEITNKVKDKLLFGHVQRLFTLDGLEVHDASNIVNDSVYVAVDKMPLKLPPFSLVGGKLQRKPQKKVKLRPLKVDPPKRKEVMVAAFGRTGLGFLHDTENGAHDTTAGAYGTLNGRGKDAGEEDPPITVHRMNDNGDAMYAIDLLVRGITTSRRLRVDNDAMDEAICALIRRARERLFEFRQTSPDITTAFDDRIEEVLQFMLNPETREENGGTDNIAERFEPMEDLMTQRLCVSEWEKTRDFFDEDDPIRDYTTKFEHNLAVIERYGRFPDRNAVLGRETTEEEMEYLQLNGKAIAPTRSVAPHTATKESLGRLKLFANSNT
ncbi:hypothetical protein PTSG_05362 [Salpingoeca rosetta]|uniref:Doublecortin domain-containing protein n=1 Tax=Salpingoeca rosetta (strain ATCC 50818 / BSB-021) TaxID=946362 RepID=F2UA77_SALR5|nr:uncharacterized protein PTSG_05362 [Salpingoeca rosetta]EGD73652.1 hypothetical protein PTSG_05362 [Salpingoeca rosetta]|eukprot:XP_004993933.1 hypothetical protein PTSG_05362 [Salpingoeca rosetta]